MTTSVLTLLKKTTSGNLECCISDHLAQFLIFPNQRVLQQNNHTKYKRSYKNVDNNRFKNELQIIDWTTALSINNNDVNQSLENFLNISNLLLDKYAPLERLTKKQMKTNCRPWITKGIVTSVKKKYKIHSKFLKAKEQTRKKALNQECKTYKNLPTNIIKKSKENYCKQYFKDNKNYLIKVWKGIKEIILIKKNK